MPRQMKKAGVEWIDKIPETWKVERLKVLFSFGKGLPITKDNLIEVGIPVISYGQIHSKLTSGVEIQEHLLRFVSSDYCESNPQSFVKRGDFIFADTSEDLEGCGNCVYVDRDMQLFAGYHTIIFNSKCGDDNKYLAYLFKTDAWRSQVRSKGSGVKLVSISRKTLGEATVILPTGSEQHRIVEYLDKQCTTIDYVLEQTRSSIEEYKKLKQAMITQTVTKGVRQDRSIKDSGISWLSQIPEEWRVERGKNLFIETKELSDTGEEELLTVSHITGVTPRSEKNVNMFMSESLVGYKICHEGDIAANTMWMWQGAIGVSKYEGVISPSYNTYRQRNNAYTSEYLEYLLRIPPLVATYAAYSTGITASRLRLYPDQFFSILFPVPPKEEQIEIVSYLNGKIPEMDRLIQKKEQFLVELENYKKSMVYEYVTGKKEVPQS